ncbi:23S rRNA (pseudouridine(1915)-N(3))-methyltransferase RlmH [Erysipelothrix urinaevulpis]|uniref:23S rRNA (pseudouridine(1915)-N(3))-methyltransferase RlmH n=1 Tax=Erysipelothrix urinaevulpis TaxID=2683717 RepID=UPI00135C1130|nr:23S rRNA (pseudouridine(1915)-N(3))-methyltransferase RlmH [Erysipelothrix urinaevulpis]
MIRIIAIGKVKEKSLQNLIVEYKKRMTSVHPIEIVELSNSKINEKNIDAVILDESQRILEKIKPNEFVILLDLQGKNLTSENLSELVSDKLDMGHQLVFIIGGSHGVNQTIKNRANYRWKLSDLTFPHQLVRLMLIEQVYRSFMIARNHPYHK